MSAVAAIIRLDLRGILRDNVMYINVLVSVVTVAAITVLGLLQEHLPGWRDWFPLMIALSLVSGPGGFGYLFGLLMVDENDTGVRNMLSVTPVRPTTLILTRTAVATAWLCVWPALTITIMNAAWQAIDLPLVEWAALILSLALLTPALALAIPTLASDKVEALAVFKGLTFVTLAPLAIYFLDADAWYRYVFLLSPTGWAVQAFDAFLAESAAGYLWAAGGAVYALVLLGCAIHFFRRNVYKLYA
jgi:fluoroquinolone transport system permease protein